MAFGKKIRLIIADDEPVARAGIRAILSQAGDIEVVGEAPDGFEAQRLVEETAPRYHDAGLSDARPASPRPGAMGTRESPQNGHIASDRPRPHVATGGHDGGGSGGLFEEGGSRK